MEDKSKILVIDANYGLLVLSSVRACTGWYDVADTEKHECYQFVAKRLPEYNNQVIWCLYSDLSDALEHGVSAFANIDREDPEIKDLMSKVIEEYNKRDISSKNRLEPEFANETFLDTDSREFSLTCYLSAVYAIGRQTYMPGVVCRMLRYYAERINMDCLDRIIELIKNTKNLGDRVIDEPDWIRTLETLEKSNKKGNRNEKNTDFV